MRAPRPRPRTSPGSLASSGTSALGTPLLAAAVLVATALGTAGCGGRPVPTATATAAASSARSAGPAAGEVADDAGPDGVAAGGRSGGEPAGGDRATPGSEPSATGPDAGTPGSSSGAAGARAGTSGAGSGYRVTYREGHEGGGPADPVDVRYPAVSVTGPVPRVRDAARLAIAGLVAGFRADFAMNAGGETPEPGRPFSQIITVAREVTWGPLYSVQLIDEIDLNGAHPVADVGAITIDLRTGRQVLPTDLFAQLGPVDRQVRAALVKVGVPAEAVGPITIARIAESDVATPAASYPTPQGLAVALSQCVTACALGVPSTLVPWTALPAPRPGALPPG